jgi:hypothetical protein
MTRPQGAPGCTGGVTKLASVVELRVADVMSAGDVKPTGTENLGDPRREILVEMPTT